MILVYYNAIADAVFVIESETDPNMSMYYNLAFKNKHNGWVFLGEL